MLAWVFRFALLALGYPVGIGLVFLIISMIVYGLAFDFYFISSSLYIDKVAQGKLRSSAQGLFMMMVNGIGAVIGAYGSGLVIDHWSDEGTKDWQVIWFVFSGYAFTITMLFLFLFKERDKKV